MFCPCVPSHVSGIRTLKTSFSLCERRGRGDEGQNRTGMQNITHLFQEIYPCEVRGMRGKRAQECRKSLPDCDPSQECEHCALSCFKSGTPAIRGNQCRWGTNTSVLCIVFYQFDMTVQGCWGFRGRRFATDDQLQRHVGLESAPHPSYSPIVASCCRINWRTASADSRASA